MIRFALAISATLALAGAAHAFEQPPITGPQDKACRDEAAAKVFDAPDPQGLGLYAIGREIYGACMQRASAVSPAPTRTARRSRPAA